MTDDQPMGQAAATRTFVRYGVLFAVEAVIETQRQVAARVAAAGIPAEDNPALGLVQGMVAGKDQFVQSITDRAMAKLGLEGAKAKKKSRPKPPKTSADYHRQGGLKRAASLTPERRSEIARAAAQARWGKKEQSK